MKSLSYAKILCALFVFCIAQSAIAGPQRQSDPKEKYHKLSDAPGQRREVRTDHFVLYTDISERSAAQLGDKLENMYGLIGAYFNSRPRNAIECYVVNDLRKFKGEIPPSYAAKIASRAGVTISASRGNSVKSIVYSCDNHSTVQHEAVHAICAQTFGSTGPTWYSEGMAEMGQYWIEDERAVRIPRHVARYLTGAEPKSLGAIVAPGQETGDSWQAYSWRWALCHLLANNPNYQDQFKRLGIGMMRKRENATFENAFGEVSQEISFEYDQFIENFNNGYRVDLCSWDWSVKTRRLKGKTRVGKTVEAAAGWQATKLEVIEGKSYDFAATGNWQLTEDGPELSADGDARGNGKMIAGILTQSEEGVYSLSEPFNLGVTGSFDAYATGQIYVRCKDSWTQLGDNDGKIKISFSRTPEEE